MASTTNDPQNLINQLQNDQQFRFDHAVSPKQAGRERLAAAKLTGLLNYTQAMQGNFVVNCHNVGHWNVVFGVDGAYGGLMSHFALFETFYNPEGTVGLETLITHEMPDFHRELRNRFPTLDMPVSYGFEALVKTSSPFKTTMDYIKKVCLDPQQMRGKIYCLCEPDIARYAISAGPDVFGYRHVAYMMVVNEIGVRTFSLMMADPPDMVRNDATGRWTLTFARVKNDKTRQPYSHTFRDNTSRWISKFYAARDSVNWHCSNNFFCISSIEAQNRNFDRRGVRAGYTRYNHSTKTLRGGYATTLAGNYVLNGMSKSQAIERVNRDGAWSMTAENVRPYIDMYILDLCEQNVANPAINQVSDFTALQLHPEMALVANHLVANPATGVMEMRGPYRPTRFLSNPGVGITDSQRQLIDDIWAMVRQPGDIVNFPVGWSRAERVAEIAPRFYQLVANTGYALP